MKVDTAKLIEIVGIDNVRDNLADLYVYASDASVHTKLPDVVVRPNSIKQVQEIVRYANKNKIPIVPRGAGSGMSGQTVPLSGGIILDMKGMNNIIDIRVEDVLCKVEPGVVNDELNDVLKKYGFFFPSNSIIRKNMYNWWYDRHKCIWQSFCKIWCYKRCSNWYESCFSKWRFS